jgi:hypothetical protein
MASQDMNLAKTAFVVQDLTNSKKPTSYYFQVPSVEQKIEWISAFERAKARV